MTVLPQSVCSMIATYLSQGSHAAFACSSIANRALCALPQSSPFIITLGYTKLPKLLPLESPPEKLMTTTTTDPYDRESLLTEGFSSHEIMLMNRDARCGENAAAADATVDRAIPPCLLADGQSPTRLSQRQLAPHTFWLIDHWTTAAVKKLGTNTGTPDDCLWLGE